MSRGTIQISPTGPSPTQVFSEWKDFRTDSTEEEHDNLPTTNHISSSSITVSINSEYDNIPITENHIGFINKNWNDLDCLNEKFDELREKEINNTLSEFERSLLKGVLKKRILEFQNPYLPLDYKEAIEMSRKYGTLKKEENKGISKAKKIFNNMFSW